MLIRVMQMAGYTVGWRSDEDHPDWPVVFVQTNTVGELSWHIPSDMLPEWIHERQDVEFDGYSREEKNQRMEDFLENSERGDS